jgi:hypothetical protein
MSDHEMPDPLIDEIRAIRARISREHGDDPQRLYEHYVEYQKQFKGRLISRTMTPDDELVFRRGLEELRRYNPDDLDRLAREAHEPQLSQQPTSTSSTPPRKQDKSAA